MYLPEDIFEETVSRRLITDYWGFQSIRSFTVVIDD